MPEAREAGSIRLLVVARHPFRLDDLCLDEVAIPIEAQLVRRKNAIEPAIDRDAPDLVLVDTSLPEGNGFTAIGDVLALAPETKVLALTSEPPPHDDVALATRAGAVGFVSVDARPTEVQDAVAAVMDGGTWFPGEEVRGILTSVADDLDTTAAERRSRLTGILVVLIPLTGLVAAIMAFLWRKYLGQIGVRPVDLAVDPASRVVDVIVAMLLALGVFGPLLFIGSWLDLLGESRWNRGPVEWMLAKRKTCHVLLSFAWLLVAAALTVGPDAALVLIVGPVVAIAILAKAIDASEELPRFLRLERLQPMRVLVGGIAAILVFIALVGGETFLVGPDLSTRGSRGYVAPRVLGFSAQPMRAFDVEEGGEPREVLYLGGNADLYVFVDPCNDDNVEFVSVGRTKLEVIDEISCPETEVP